MSSGHGGRLAGSLAGAFNFRDLGGLPAAGGRRTRSGLLFRSDTLQALTEADVAYLVRILGVTAVMDLRDADEAVEQGRGLLGTSPLCYVNLPLAPAPATGAAPASAGGSTLDFYLNHLEAPSSVLPLAVAILAVALDRPAVVHCAAGKDRTGLVIALALGIAGVSDDAIVADYMATAQNMPRISERFETWPRYQAHMAAADPELYQVQEQPIRAFLSEVARRYGGARGWARQRGLPETLLDLLASRLTEA